MHTLHPALVSHNHASVTHVLPQSPDFECHSPTFRTPSQEHVITQSSALIPVRSRVSMQSVRLTAIRVHSCSST